MPLNDQNRKFKHPQVQKQSNSSTLASPAGNSPASVPPAGNGLQDFLNRLPKGSKLLRIHNPRLNREYRPEPQASVSPAKSQRPRVRAVYQGQEMPLREALAKAFSNQGGTETDDQQSTTAGVKPPKKPTGQDPWKHGACRSNAKTWWQQNSDRLGSDLNWDTFSEVWMAALNSNDVPPLSMVTSLVERWKETIPKVQHVWGVQSFLDWLKKSGAK